MKIMYVLFSFKLVLKGEGSQPANSCSLHKIDLYVLFMLSIDICIRYI